MKNKILILVSILSLLFLTSLSHAGIVSQYLDTNSVDWDEKALTTTTGTYYTDGVTQTYSKGFASLLILTSDGSLAVSYEVSDDNTNFYTPYNTSGNALNSISTAVTADKWIVFAPQIAEYIRFKFVLTSADSTVTAVYRQVQ